MKKWQITGFLAVLIMGFLLISGCTQDNNKYCRDNFPGTIYDPSSKMCDHPPVPTDQQITSTPESTASQLATPNVSESATGTIASLPSAKEIIIDPAAMNQLTFQNSDFSSVLITSKFECWAAEMFDPNSTILNGFQNGGAFDGTFDKNSGRIMQWVLVMDSQANASKTYDIFDKLAENQFQKFAKVPLTNVSVSVGDRGKMYVFHNIDQGSLIYYLIFVRGNVMETIGLEVPITSKQGDDIILDLTGKADRKIISQPPPIISTEPCPTGVLVPPPTRFTVKVSPAHTPIPSVRPPPHIGNTIAIKNFAFTPSSLTVKSGTAVIWTNQDATPHAIVFDIGSPVTYSSGSIPPDSSYSLSFTEPGTYMYHCSIHPSTKGTIIVQT